MLSQKTGTLISFGDWTRRHLRRECEKMMSLKSSIFLKTLQLAILSIWDRELWTTYFTHTIQKHDHSHQRKAQTQTNQKSFRFWDLADRHRLWIVAAHWSRRRWVVANAELSAITPWNRRRDPRSTHTKFTNIQLKARGAFLWQSLLNMNAVDLRETTIKSTGKTP